MKRSKVLVIVLAAVMLLTMFTGCGGTATTTTNAAAAATTVAPSTEKIKIGLSLPTQREERWVRDKARMEEVAAKLGVELIVKVADANMSEQVSQVESLLNQGIKVLILAPHDASAASSLVDQAKEKGIPVIAYDRMITGTSNLDYYISFDNVRVGELQGEYISKAVPKGNYIIMSGSPTDNNAKLFKEGAMKFLQPLIDSGAIKVVAEQAVDNWEPQNALKIVEAALLASKNDIQGILAPNDGTAGASIEALAAQGLDGKVPITGQDAELAAAQRIVAGKQSMTIFKDTRVTAEKAIEMAIAAAKGEKIETNGAVGNGTKDIPSVLIDAQVVDKNNIDVLIESGYLKKEDIYK